MQDESGKYRLHPKLIGQSSEHDYKKKIKIKVILEVPDLSTLT